MFIIYKFSPSHFTLAMIMESFTHMGYKIINSLVTKKTARWSQYTNIGIYVILFIGSMIHNEIFFINRCGLNKKTQLYLNSEVNDETNNLDDISSRSNNDSSSRGSRDSRNQREMTVFV